MRRLLGWLTRWVLLLPSLDAAVAALRTALRPLLNAVGWQALLGSQALWAAVAGFGFRVLCTRWRRQDPWEFLDTLEHELTHAASGALTLAPPVSLTATVRKGGAVELRRTNPVAVLAPYCLPLYAFLAAILTLWLRTGLLPYGRWAVGFLLGGFAYRLRREFHGGQTDFRTYGWIFSFVFIAAWLPLCLAFILSLARMVDLPWHYGVWPLCLEQLQWVVHAARHAATPAHA